MNKKEVLGDCLIESENIKSGSVDLILTDLPFGTVKEIKNVKHGLSGKCEWDNIINTDKIMQIANRILRKNGKMILFAQEPFTTELKQKALPNLPFNYRMIWEKDHFANSLAAKKAPVSFFEDILMFSKNHDFEGLHPLRKYFLNEKQESGLTDSEIKKILGNGMGGHYFTKGSQFCLPTLVNYRKLQTTGYFKKDWDNLKQIDAIFKKEYPSTFNLWQGRKNKSNILKYKKDYNSYHPTQKPIALLADLIKTFSNENDLVVDLTAGSFSTAIAALNTNRNYICIEKDKDYYNIGLKRIKEWHQNHKQTKLF